MLLDLVQDSPSWHEWRATGIGGSDIPVVMGVSPYKTIRRLYLEKTKQIEVENVSNFATERGKRWEPKIRAIYELRTGKDFTPKCATYDNHPQMIVSLDGVSDDLELLEIKVAGAEVFNAAKGQLPAELSHLLTSWNAEKFCSGGLVHPKYYPQVQWQLMVTGSKLLHFVAAYIKNIKGKETFLDMAVVMVEPDPEFHELLRKEAQKFFNCVATLTPPPATDEDYEFMEDATILAAGKKLEANRAGADYAAVRKELVALMEDIKHPRWVIGKFFAVKKKDGVWTFFYDETLDELSGVDSTSVSPGTTARASNASDISSEDSSEVRHAG